MGTILVCPLSRLRQVLAASGARTVVTLMAEREGTLPPLDGVRHLAIDLSDISAPCAGYTLPSEAHVATLLRGVAEWDRRAPLLMHCHAGVSRSTAAAFAAVCALRPGIDEAALAAELRAASPSATPNPRLIALADAALGRRNRVIAAIAAIGRGRDCFEGEVFGLDVPDPDQIPAHQL